MVCPGVARCVFDFQDGKSQIPLPSDANVLDVVVDAMAKHANSDAVQSKGCRLLSRLVTGVVRSARSNALARCVTVVVDVMDTFQEYPDVQEQACALILALAKVPGVTASLIDAGAVARVQRAHDRHIVSAGVVALSSQALAALSSDGSDASSVLASVEDLARIFEVMDATVESAVAQEAVCTRLADLASNGDNHDKLISLGLTPRLYRAMRTHLGEWPSRGWRALVAGLVSTYQCSVNWKPQCTRAHVVVCVGVCVCVCDVLVPSAADATSLQAQVLTVLHLLVGNDNFEDSVDGEGGLRILLTVTRRHCNVSEVVAPSCAVIRDLCGNHDLRYGGAQCVTRCSNSIRGAMRVFLVSRSFCCSTCDHAHALPTPAPHCAGRRCCVKAPWP